VFDIIYHGKESESNILDKVILPSYIFLVLIRLHNLECTFKFKNILNYII